MERCNEEFNAIFNRNNIPIIINNINNKEMPRIIKNKVFKSCSHKASDSAEYSVFVNINNNDIIGYVALDISDKCIYITYMCVSDKYKGYNFGVFMGFYAIYIGELLNKTAVISYGVGKKSPAHYERLGGRFWVISQGLLITKLGFIDGFKVDTYDISKLQEINDLCGDFGETYLFLNDRNEKYNTYKSDFFNEPQKVFKKYKNFINYLQRSRRTKSRSSKRRSRKYSRNIKSNPTFKSRKSNSAKFTKRKSAP